MSESIKAVLWTLGICIAVWAIFDTGFSRYVSPLFASPAAVQRPAHADLNQAFTTLRSYVANQYPEWTLTGHTVDVDDLSSSTMSTFDVHLTKGTDTKVVSLTLEEFTKNDGTKYWAVSPTPLAKPTAEE